MGRPWLPRLGFRERAALLQARGGQRERRRRLSRHGRPAGGLQQPHAAPAVGGLSPVLHRQRHEPHGRNQHAASSGRRLRARHPAPGAAVERGPRLSPAGDGAEERASADTCPRAACAVRGQTCHKRRVRPPGPYRAGEGGWRRDSLGRRLRVAAAPHAFGRRPGRPYERIRRAGGPRPAGRRREPSGSSGPRPDLLGKRDDLQHANRPRPRDWYWARSGCSQGPGRGPRPIPR